MELVKPLRKRPLARARRRWEENTRIDLEVIGVITRNWINSSLGRDYFRALVNAALYLRVS